MKSTIRRLAALILVAYLVVGSYLGYWQLVRASDLTADVKINAARLKAAEERIPRGRILDRRGVVLARTEPIGGGSRRVYTQPWLAHVIGFHSFLYGNTGIEQAFDRYLRGASEPDVITTLLRRLLGRPAEGSDIILTIDSQLQQVAEEALGEHNGAIVVIDPRTGEILALVSHPNYDPNILEQDWETLKEDPGQPLVNRATQSQYGHGSTFKTVTLSAMLDAGLIAPDAAVQCPTELDIGGFIVISHNQPEDKTSFNLAESYAWSCNTTFADLGLRLGPSRLIEYGRRFGFETEIPFELPVAVSHLASDLAFLKDRVALASTAFGQGQLVVTPLQMALIAAAIANDGVVPQPYLVAEVRGEKGTEYVGRPQAWRRAVMPETAATVKSMMVLSAEIGWARPAQVPGMVVAGKTGTAEAAPGQESHAWFIGFAPADNPRIAVAIVKEHAGSGSYEAAPVAKTIFEAALRLGIIRGGKE